MHWPAVSMSSFQSTPVIADGRILRAFVGVSDKFVFQSTPVIADGRIAVEDARTSRVSAVSIHARHC